MPRVEECAFEILDSGSFPASDFFLAPHLQALRSSSPLRTANLAKHATELEFGCSVEANEETKAKIISREINLHTHIRNHEEAHQRYDDLVDKLAELSSEDPTRLLLEVQAAQAHLLILQTALTLPESIRGHSQSEFDSLAALLP